MKQTAAQASQPFVAFEVRYNRSTKSYEATTYHASHIHIVPNGIITDNGPAGVYRCIGMVIAGELGPKEPAKRGALLAAMLAFVGSDTNVDTSSFSHPIISL